MSCIRSCFCLGYMIIKVKAKVSVLICPEIHVTTHILQTLLSPGSNDVFVQVPKCSQKLDLPYVF